MLFRILHPIVLLPLYYEKNDLIMLKLDPNIVELPALASRLYSGSIGARGLASGFLKISLCCNDSAPPT